MTNDMTNTLEAVALALLAHEWGDALPNREVMGVEYGHSKSYWDGAAQAAINSLTALGWVSPEAARAVKKPTHKDAALGTKYSIVGKAELQTKYELDNGADLVIYKHEDSSLWATPTYEFEDNFVELAGEKP